MANGSTRSVNVTSGDSYLKQVHELEDEKFDAEETQRATESAEFQATNDWEGSGARDKVTTDTKTGNDRIDRKKLQESNLGRTLTYDPRKGSGMYTGAQNFVQSNMPQASDMANKAYNINESRQNEDVTFGSALSEDGKEFGSFDRALLSGFSGPSQDKKAQTQQEAISALQQRLSAGGLAGTLADHNVKSVLDKQFKEGQDEARDKYVAAQVAAKAGEIKAKNAELTAKIEQVKQEEEAARKQQTAKLFEAARKQIPAQFGVEQFESVNNWFQKAKHTDPNMARYEELHGRFAPAKLMQDYESFAADFARYYGNDPNRLPYNQRETAAKFAEMGLMEPFQYYGQ